MSRRFFGLFLLFAFGCWTSAIAQERDVTKVGTTAAPFLEIEVGSRAIGMGGAFVAIANDASALYWNPAGLARMNQGEVFLSHTEWLADTRHDFAGIALPTSFGTAGFMFSSLNMAEMQVRTVSLPEGTGEFFDANSFLLGISFARNLTDRFSIGCNAKYVHETIWHMSSSAIAFDIGTLFSTPVNGLKLGMSISNFGNKMQLLGKDTQIKYDPVPGSYGNNSKIDASLRTASWSLPLLFRVGFSYDALQIKDNQLILAVDAAHPNNNTEFMNLGAEYIFKEAFSLRVGYKSLFMLDSEEGLTAGAGFKYKIIGQVQLHLDYAYADFGILSNVQRFSLGINF